MGLFKGEKVYDDKNAHELIGDGKAVFANGEMRYLSRTPPLANSKAPKSIPFKDSGIVKISRNEWDARLDEQERMLRRSSDFCDFDPLDQDGTPECWGNGPVGSVMTTRRIMGLPHVRLSPASICGPITGYKYRGGWEGDAYEYLTETGAVPVEVWGSEYDLENSSFNSKPEVTACRPFFKALELVDCEDDFDAWATCCLLTMTGGFAYNWMSHVMQACDLVRIESGSYGLRQRNSWGNWGAKNSKGYYGFNTYREGKGTPDSGWMLRQVTPSIWPPA